MKKKIVIGVAFCLFVVTSMFSFKISKQNEIGDMSLKSIAVMAQANAENPDCPNGCYDNGNGCYCYTWYGCYREAS